jgi:hypothetical protein
MAFQLQDKKVVWTGRVLSTLVTLPLAMSVIMKIKGGTQLEEGFAHLGLPMGMLSTLIVLEALAVILYAIPQTAVMGAIVLTGYMGGAICTHLRLGEPVVIQTLIPILAWLGLFLREPRLQSILPIRR